MALNLFNKLQKLTINAYGNALRAGLPKPGGSFKVMFNPESLSTSHTNKFSHLQGIATTGRDANYAYSRSNVISLKLVLDGSGVTDYGISTLLGMGTKSVAEQINQFMKLCFHMDGKLHRPKYLKIQWGDGVLKDFSCILKSVDIEYSLFDRNGAPLHAVLTTKFEEDIGSQKLNRKAGKSSPDLTHSRIVKHGDTLPLLCKEIYGSSRHYLRLAQVNNINDFRNLTPGQEIFFPPLNTNETNTDEANTNETIASGING